MMKGSVHSLWASPLNHKNGKGIHSPLAVALLNLFLALQPTQMSAILLKTEGRNQGGVERPHVKPPGMNGIDIAPLNIFENQVIPVGVHNLS